MQVNIAHPVQKARKPSRSPPPVRRRNDESRNGVEKPAGPFIASTQSDSNHRHWGKARLMTQPSSPSTNIHLPILAVYTPWHCTARRLSGLGRLIGYNTAEHLHMHVHTCSSSNLTTSTVYVNSYLHESQRSNLPRHLQLSIPRSNLLRCGSGWEYGIFDPSTDWGRSQPKLEPSIDPRILIEPPTCMALRNQNQRKR